MTGKEKCKILKEIRNKIALLNEIDFVSSECDYEGECQGFCPKCDSEAHFLDKELQNRADMGYRINLSPLNDLSIFDIIDTSDGKIVDSSLEIDERLKEYIVLPENENVEIEGLLGDIVPDDFDDIW
jgi:hypothetical protein